MAMLCTTIRWVVAVKDVRARSEHSRIANINNAARCRSATPCFVCQAHVISEIGLQIDGQHLVRHGSGQAPCCAFTYMHGKGGLSSFCSMTA